MPILTFPDTRQATPSTCGASVTQGILYYYGIEKREDELIEALGVTEEEGVGIGPIVNYLRGQGLRTTSGRMTVADLKRWLDSGVPVILMIQAWPEEGTRPDYATDLEDGHYVIAVGYGGGHILFEDPSLLSNRGYIAENDLEIRWHDVDAGDEVLDHFGVAVWGRKPSYDPKKVIHIAIDRVATRWLKSRIAACRPGRTGRALPPHPKGRNWS